MKYKLKDYMRYTQFEVQIIQAKKNQFEIMIMEIKGYSMDDPFYFIVDTKTTLGEAKQVQSDVFMYMMDNDFTQVGKSYFRMG